MGRRYNFEEIILDAQSDPNLHLSYSWQNGELRRKGKLVVGNLENLKSKFLELYHDSAIGGHSGVSVTGRRLASVV